MTQYQKQHLLEQLRQRGHFAEADRLMDTDHSDMDFTNGVFAGIVASELMSGFDSSSYESASSFDVAPASDYSGGGGDFGGGGSGGDF